MKEAIEITNNLHHGNYSKRQKIPKITVFFPQVVAVIALGMCMSTAQYGFDVFS